MQLNNLMPNASLRPAGSKPDTVTRCATTDGLGLVVRQQAHQPDLRGPHAVKLTTPVLGGAA